MIASGASREGQNVAIVSTSEHGRATHDRVAMDRRRRDLAACQWWRRYGCAGVVFAQQSGAI
jgi:hypothetical protein